MGVDERNSPLVSIIVITYNSSKYVLETLESAKAQTYKNIELIVTDDCSTDKTVELCNQWISENSDRFKTAKLITTIKNSGIPTNCNRGVNESNGEWIKLIAGDDILLDNCVEDGVAFISLNNQSKIFASNVVKFTHSHINEKTNITELHNLRFFDVQTTPDFQLKQIMLFNPIIAPSVFINRELFELLNGFDESIPYMEDYPFWIKTLKAGILIDFLPKTTVAYRLSETSVSGFNSRKIFNSFYRQHYKFQREHTFKYMGARQRFNQSYIYLTKRLFDFFYLNHQRNSALYKFALKVNFLNAFN